MARLVPVDYDPFAAPAAAPRFVPVDYDPFAASAPPRETTWGEFGTGLAIDVLGVAPQRAVKSIADLGDLFGIPGAQAASDFFQRGIDAGRELRPEAYVAQRKITPVVRDAQGNIAGLRTPSAEAILGTVGESVAALPFFLAGGGALRNVAARGLGAMGHTGRAAQAGAAAAGYGGVNTALVAPSEADDVYREAYKAALDGELGAIMFNGGTPTPEQVAAAKATADVKARDAELTALSMLAPLTAVTGAIPGALALRGAQASDSLLGAMMRGGAADAPFEFTEEAGTSAIKDAALGRDISLADALDAGLMATAAGAVQGAAVGAAEYRGQRAAEAKIKAAQAQFDSEASAAAEAAGGMITGERATAIAERVALAHGVTVDDVLRSAPPEADEQADHAQPGVAQPTPTVPTATPEADEAAANDIMDALMAAGLEPSPVLEQGGNPAPVASADGSQPEAAVSTLGEQFAQPPPSPSVALGETPQDDAPVTGRAPQAVEAQQELEPALEPHEQPPRTRPPASPGDDAPFQRLEAPSDSGIPAGLPAQQTAASRSLAGKLNRFRYREAQRRGQPAPPELQFREIDPASLPDDARRAVADFQQATGTRIAIVRNLTPDVDRFNGVNFGDGVLYIDEKADRPFALAAAHEWVHQLRRDDPAAYKRLEDEVRRQADMPAWVERMRDEGNRTDEAGATEELTADAVADAMIDPTFLRRVAEDSGTLRRAAQSFLRFLDGMLGRIRGRNTSAYMRDVQAFRDELAAVLRQYKNVHDAPTDAQLEADAAQFEPETTVGTPQFRRWFQNSAVVDSNGRPLAVYHGTSQEFEAFDPSLLSTATTHATSGLGFFFTPDRAMAQQYADSAANNVPADATVLDVFLSIQRPYTMTLDEAQSIEDAAEAKAMRMSLQAQGFDGIHIPEQNAWVAFRPNQVKRTDNLGEWNPNDDRMRFMRRDADPQAGEDNDTDTPFGNAAPQALRFTPLRDLPATKPDGTPRRGIAQMQKALAQKIGRGLDPTENAALVAFMDRFSAHLADIGLSFRRGDGAQGQFHPEAGIVEVFSRAIEEGSVKRTTIHEFWHALARSLSESQAESVRSAYRRAKAKWRKANPALSSFMDAQNWTLDGSAAQAWMRQTPDARALEGAGTIIVTRKDGAVQSVRLARTDETYRYVNADEFFAEEMTDRTEAAEESAEARGVLNAARKIMAELWYMLRRIVGRAEVDRLFRDFMGGRVAPGVQRRSIDERTVGVLSERDEQEARSGRDADNESLRPSDTAGNPLESRRDVPTASPENRITVEVPARLGGKLRNILNNEMTAFREQYERLFNPNRPKSPQSRTDQLASSALAFVSTITSRFKMLQARYPDSKGLQALRAMVATSPGTDRATPETLTERVQRRYAMGSNRFGRILEANGLEKMTSAQNDQLREAILDPKAIVPPNIRTAANALARMFETTAEDARAAGLEFGEVKDIGYLTRIYDEAAIVDRQADFLRDAEKLYAGPEFDAAVGATARNIVYEKARLTEFMLAAKAAAQNSEDVRLALSNIKDHLRAYRSGGDLEGIRKIEAEIASVRSIVAQDYGKRRAQAWLYGILTPSMRDSFAVTQSPGAPMLKGRELSAAADTMMADWLITDVPTIVDTYLRGMARKTAFAETFGPAGEKVEAATRQMIDEGVAPHDAALAQRMAATVAGQMQTQLATEISSALDWLHAVGYVAMLDKAVIASLAEPVAMTIRTRNFRNFAGPLVQVWRAMTKSEKAKATAELAQMVGIITNRGAEAVLLNQLGGDHALAPKPAALLNNFFRITLLAQLTNSQRTFAAGVAHDHLVNLAKRLGSGKDRQNTEALLRELGVIEPDGFASFVLASQGYPKASALFDQEGRPTPMGEVYTVAVRRFVDQTIQNPNAGLRPELVNNSLGRFVYGIMSFSYSFYENIIKREVSVLARRYESDGAPAAVKEAVMASIPAFAALALAQTLVSTLRELIFNAARYEEMEDEEAAEKLLLLGLQRSFGLGSFDPLIQYVSGLRYSRSAAETAIGAVPGMFLSAVDDMTNLGGEKNAETTTTTEYRAARAFYSAFLQPVFNAAMSFAPGGTISAKFATLGVTVGGDLGRDRFAELFGIPPERMTAIDEAYTEERKRVAEVMAEIQGRILSQPQEGWAAELDKLKAEYPGLLDSVELDVYADNAQNRRLGRAGMPKPARDGRLPLKPMEGGTDVLGELRGRTVFRSVGGRTRAVTEDGLEDQVSDLNKAIETLRENRDIAVVELQQLAPLAPVTQQAIERVGRDLSKPARRSEVIAAIRALEADRRDLKREAVELIRGAPIPDR